MPVYKSPQNLVRISMPPFVRTSSPSRSPRSRKHAVLIGGSENTGDKRARMKEREGVAKKKGRPTKTKKSTVGRSRAAVATRLSKHSFGRAGDEI